MKLLLCCCALMLLFVQPTWPAEEGGGFASSQVSQSRVYLPGDVVHVVVGAPVDVNEILAVLPNGDKLQLDFDRRTRTWHGHWEIPYGFSKGDYRATLIATDVEGKSFQGKTASFYVGEPALVTLIGVDLKRNVDLPKETVKEPQYEPARPVVKPTPKPVAKPKPKPKPKPAPKKAAVVPKKEVKPTVNAEKLQLEKARLITEARYYFQQQDYKRGRARLAELSRLDPNSREIKEIISRIDEVIKAKESGK